MWPTCILPWILVGLFQSTWDFWTPEGFEFEFFSAGSQIPLGYKLAKHISWQRVEFISEYAGAPNLQLAQMNYTEVEDTRNPAVIQQRTSHGLTVSEDRKEWPSVIALWI